VRALYGEVTEVAYKPDRLGAKKLCMEPGIPHTHPSNCRPAGQIHVLYNVYMYSHCSKTLVPASLACELFFSKIDLHNVQSRDARLLVFVGLRHRRRLQDVMCVNQYAFISNMKIARLLQYLEVIKRIHKNLR